MESKSLPAYDSLTHESEPAKTPEVESEVDFRRGLR